MGLTELSEALRELNQLKEKGVIEDYAIGGGYAAIYYTVPYFTSDLDIFAILHKNEDFQSIYQHFREKGNKIEGVYIHIGDMPTQILPNISPLYSEAIEQAHEVIIEGIPSKVIRIEHLIVLALEVFRAKDKYRITQLLEKADREILDKIIDRFDDDKGKLRTRFKEILAGT